MKTLLLKKLTISNSTRFLGDRLRELGVNQGGLPPHVLASLKGLIQAEIQKIQGELDQQISILQLRATEQIKKRITGVITLRSIGKAFGQAATNPQGGDAK